MTKVEFAKFTPEETELVLQIIDRAVAMGRKMGLRVDRLTLQMDIAATHAQCPLRLADLVEAEDFDFGHDVFGIVRHMDRSTGKLGGCFLPRLSA